jgi:hypothetical protein
MDKTFDYASFETPPKYNLRWFKFWRDLLIVFLVMTMISFGFRLVSITYEGNWLSDENWFWLRGLLILAIIVITIILAFFTLDEKELESQHRGQMRLVRVLSKHLNSLPKESVEVQNKSLALFLAEVQDDLELCEAYTGILDRETNLLIGKYCREQIKIEMQESVVNAKANLAGHIKSDVAAAVLQRHAAKIHVLNAIAVKSPKTA